MVDFKAGDVVENSHYSIEISENLEWNTNTRRWLAKGYRWLPSMKVWDKHQKTYGFVNPVKCKKNLPVRK